MAVREELSMLLPMMSKVQVQQVLVISALMLLVVMAVGQLLEKLMALVAVVVVALSLVRVPQQLSLALREEQVVKLDY